MFSCERATESVHARKLANLKERVYLPRVRGWKRMYEGRRGWKSVEERGRGCKTASEGGRGCAREYL